MSINPQNRTSCAYNILFNYLKLPSTENQMWTYQGTVTPAKKTPCQTTCSLTRLVLQFYPYEITKFTKLPHTEKSEWGCVKEKIPIGEEQSAADSITRRAVLTRRKGKSRPANSLIVRCDNRRLPAAGSELFHFIPRQTPPRPATADTASLLIPIADTYTFISRSPISASSSERISSHRSASALDLNILHLSKQEAVPA